jgi:predicted permease
MPVRPFLETVAQDIRYAVRGLRRHPSFAVTAILAIVLGTGASTAVFSVVDRILFRSLPYPQDNRLVSVGLTAPIAEQEFLLGSDYVEWRDRFAPFEAITTWSGVSSCDLNDQIPVRLGCARVESTFLATLGVHPLMGRDFAAGDDRPSAPKVALLSHSLWRSRFGADPRAVGKRVPIDGQPTTIVGILPQEFEMPTLETAEILVPQALDMAQQKRPNSGWILSAFARLKNGISIPQAEAALQPFFTDSLKWVPPQFRKEVHLRVRSLRDRQVHDAKLASWMLLGSVIAVLLIACANVANLLLARATGRERELAVRSALGATRSRLVRQSFTESLLLGLMGGIAGSSLAWLLLRIIVAIGPEGIPHLHQAKLDLRVLAFTLAASLVSGMLFGLAPALQGLRADLLGAGHTIQGSRHLFRKVLVTAQIAVSMVLLTCAGLLLLSLRKLQNVPLGMQTQRVTVASVVLGRELYPDLVQRWNFFERLESRLQGMPGEIAITDSVPLGPSHFTLFTTIAVEGRPRPEQGTGGTVVWRIVTPGYFNALNIPILRGRDFVEEDRGPGNSSVIISKALAERMFPHEDPLGRRIQPNFTPPWFTVIGVAGDVKNNTLVSAPDPEYYFVRKHAADYGLGNRVPENGERAASVVLRSSLQQRAVFDWVRNEIAALDPALPVQLETMELRVGKLEQQPRFNALLLGLFAGTGLLLSMIGLYGVISFLVAERTREIGVRIALGATPGAIMKLILTQAVSWTLAGVAVGCAAAFFAARLLKALLFETPASDYRSLMISMVLLLTVAMLAAAIPSRRAAGIDPVVALRQE